jgi:hypothetical protein
MEFLPSTITLTFRQLSQVEESDSKLQVLTSLSIIISQLEDKVYNFIVFPNFIEDVSLHITDYQPFSSAMENM